MARPCGVGNVEVERPNPAPRSGGLVIGVDAWLSPLLTGATPDGANVLSVANPRNYQRAHAKLANVQRVASRRQGPVKGAGSSNRWRKANRRVQLVHAHVRNHRLTTLHQVMAEEPCRVATGWLHRQPSPIAFAEGADPILGLPEMVRSRRCGLKFRRRQRCWFSKPPVKRWWREVAVWVFLGDRGLACV